MPRAPTTPPKQPQNLACAPAPSATTTLPSSLGATPSSNALAQAAIAPTTKNKASASLRATPTSSAQMKFQSIVATSRHANSSSPLAANGVSRTSPDSLKPPTILRKLSSHSRVHQSHSVSSALGQPPWKSLTSFQHLAPRYTSPNLQRKSCQRSTPKSDNCSLVMPKPSAV